mgnify:CR=1
MPVLPIFVNYYLFVVEYFAAHTLILLAVILTKCSAQEGCFATLDGAAVSVKPMPVFHTMAVSLKR